MKNHRFLQQARIDAKLTQPEIAERLNITREAVSQWERGHAHPSIDTLLELAKIYNRPVLYLLGEMGWADEIKNPDLREFVLNPENRVWLELSMQMQRSGQTPEVFASFIETILKHYNNSIQK